MLISMNWIKDYVDLSGLDLPALIQKFTLSTAEVEEIIIKGNDIKDVVAAKILSVEKHPDSKKLHLLKVDGGDKIYDVVCGAPNVAEGMVIPFVKEGGMVAGKDIVRAKIAGYESQGMCCSELELGISAEHGGLMELPLDTVIGTDITEIFDIKDIVFEVDNKSLTNRPDLWGHYGVAREFAAISGRALKPLSMMDLSEYDSLTPIDIDIIDRENCLRYSGLKVTNITRKISPVNLRIRLFYCGSRALNLLADLTNYLMMEMGQPMHAFDNKKVDRIEVQRFDKAFSFTTLDGDERHIDENTMMISSGGQPVAVAGIMGGMASEIEDDTDSLLLESANFDPVSVRKTSTRLGLRTDASMRYEKTLDPEMTTQAIKRFMLLLTAIDPGVQVSSALTDVYVKKYPEIKIDFSKADVDRYTGIDISSEEIVRTLTALDFDISAQGDSFSAKVPSNRATKDVTLKADIIEEITRIHGYDNFKITTTRSPLFPVKRSPANLSDNYCKDILIQDFHLHEVNSYIWNDNKKLKEIGIEPEQNVRIINAMTPELDTIRSCIVPSLLCFVHENLSYAPDFGIFEIARVVEGIDDGMCNERKKLGIALYSRTDSEEKLYFLVIKMVQQLVSHILHREVQMEKVQASYSWQHPVNTTRVSIDGEELGFICSLHPVVTDRLDKRAKLVTAQLDMGVFASIPPKSIAYRQPSKYPGIDIDLSLVLKPGTIYADLAPCWDIEGMPLKNVELVDIFEMGELKSITLRFAFSADDHTLSMEEIQQYKDQILDNLKNLDIELKQ